MTAHKAQCSALIVEDDPDLAALIGLHLQDADFAVQSVDNGLQGLAQALAERWDLLVLDVRLPGMDGLDVCRELRTSRNPVPILMLTALDSELDRVLGLEIGADDYLAKPFSVLELKARARALVRRHQQFDHADTKQAEPEIFDPTLPGETATRLQIGDLCIDPRQYSVWSGTSEVRLTRREFALLWYLASRAGRVARRDEIIDAIWGESHDGYEHTINSHINRLRGKLRKARHRSVTIQTVWGVGYRLSQDEQPGS